MNTDWKSYAELLGMVAVVASLVFVGLELRQSQKIASAEMLANDWANLLEVTNAKIDNAEVWIKGNTSQKMSPVEEEIFGQLVIMESTHFFYAIEQFGLLGLEYEAASVAPLAAYFHENPQARRLWRSHEIRIAKYRGMLDPNEKFTPDWIDRVESAIAAFERQAEVEQ